MKKNGKSFYWASKVLSKDKIEKVSQLYYVLRDLDDLADVSGTTHNASIFKVLIPQSGNTYGFADLRSVTDSYIRLRDLSDVANASPADGSLLRFDSGNSLWMMVDAATVGAGMQP